MIYVTQGLKESIGLEIFFKSIFLVNETNLDNITLVGEKNSIETTLVLSKLNYTLTSDLLEIENIKIKCILVNKSNVPETTSTLLKVLSVITDKDILVTLPTSKCQLIYDGKSFAGYTEFLRYFFKTPYIAMNFVSPRENVALVSDHIPLKEVPLLDENHIYNKIASSIDGHNRYFRNIDTLIIAGINPHAGENGIIGDEDKKLTTIINKLKKEYPKVKIIGPVSGDTLHFFDHDNSDGKYGNILKIYQFHDQGLPPFKTDSGLAGINVSLGLPFLRVSVDHGTAPDLYGKNQANYLSCFYLLNEVIHIQKVLTSA